MLFSDFLRGFDSPDYQVGDELNGRYRLASVLCSGGMGTVWRAHDLVLDLDVAVKISGTSTGEPPSVVAERTLREARAAARITHAAICRALDFGVTSHDDAFVVTELLEGETLGDLLARRGRLPALEAVRILLPVLDALDALHSHGIVHRDVKPDNIFLCSCSVRRLRPKLLDFGVARLAEASTRLTLAGRVMGTPNFMSPEQVRGDQSIDHRSDVWSVCALLFDLIEGKLPFEGQDHCDTMRNIVFCPVPRFSSGGAGYTSLWRIVKRGLSKCPEDRYSSARELGTALAGWLLQCGVLEDISGNHLRHAWSGAAHIHGPVEGAPPSVLPPSRRSTLPPPRRGASGTRRYARRNPVSGATPPGSQQRFSPRALLTSATALFAAPPRGTARRLVK